MLGFRLCLSELSTIHVDTRELLMWCVAEETARRASKGESEVWAYINVLASRCEVNRINEDLQDELQQVVAAGSGLEFAAVGTAWAAHAMEVRKERGEC